jgi:hypothetical protein
LHWRAPGTQTPAQLPFEQTKGHAVVLCQLPLASHVWDALPLRRRVPGTQTPTQLPLEQVNGQGEPLCQLPVASHVWGTAPTHCWLPGTQTPQVPPSQATPASSSRKSIPTEALPLRRSTS